MRQSTIAEEPRLRRWVQWAFRRPCLACASTAPTTSGLGLCPSCAARLVSAPRRTCLACGRAVARAAGPQGKLDEARCAPCGARRADDLRLHWGYRYQPPIDHVLRNLKMNGLQPLGECLGARLWRLRGWAIRSPVDRVIPVPSTWWQELRRGFNPAEEIARPIATALGVPLLKLPQQWFRRPQKRLDRLQRLGNLQRAFQVGRRPGIAGRSVLVVDDVVTTGATLRAMTRMLLRAGAGEVQCLAACRTPVGGETGFDDLAERPYTQL